MLSCMHALLFRIAGANTQLIDVHGGTAPQWAEVKGQTTTAELGRQHAAPPQQAAASPAAPPDADEPVVRSPAPLPLEIHTTRPGGASCIRWSSGFPTQGRPCRRALSCPSCSVPCQRGGAREVAVRRRSARVGDVRDGTLPARVVCEAAVSKAVIEDK